jgi:hypothetical protein
LISSLFACLPSIHLYTQYGMASTGGARFHLTAFAYGEDLTPQLDLEKVFSLLSTTLRMHEYTQLLTSEHVSS